MSSIRENHRGLRDKLRELLRTHPRGLSCRQLRTRLERRPPPSVIAGILKHMLTDGEVELIRGTTYRLRSQRVKSPMVTPSNNVREPYGTGAANLLERVAERLAISRWGDFRKLCSYYAECVRLQDRPSIIENVTAENKRFITLRHSLDFASLGFGEHIIVEVPNQAAKFITRIAGNRTNDTLFIGAPVSVIPFTREGQKEVAVSPVFVQEVRYERTADNRLALEPLSSLEVNYRWLEKRFPKSDDRRVFSELCGFNTPDHVNLGEDVPEEVTGSQALRNLDFQESVATLFQFYRDDWEEFPDLRNLSEEPELSKLNRQGIYNRALVISRPRLKYSQRLYTELKWLANRAPDEDLDNSALVHLFPHRTTEQTDSSTASRPDDLWPDVADVSGLNPEQKKACRNSISKPLTVITGPPGTGKSRVVAETMLNMAMRKRPVLFASRNHQALEAVVPRLNALVEPDVLAIRLSRPFGEGLPASLAQAIAGVLTDPRSNADNHHAEHVDELKRLLGESRDAEKKRDAVFQLYDELETISRQLEIDLCREPDHFAKIVLSAPELPQRRMISAISNSLNRLQKPPGELVPRVAWSVWKWLRGPAWIHKARRIDSQLCEIFGTRPTAARTIGEKASVEVLSRLLNEWARITDISATARSADSIRSRLGTMQSLEECYEEFAACRLRVQAASERAARSFAANAGSSIAPEIRETFAAIASELEAHGENVEYQPASLQKALKRNLRHIIAALPLWATTNLSVGKNVPLVSGVFDLLILDEASQCDIASVVPLLYRSRRAAIVGDPMQLQHVCTMKPDVDHTLRRRFGVEGIEFGLYSSRVNSMYKLASNHRNVTAPVRLLDHYRCHEQVAKYCNDVFYRDTLRIMTNRESLQHPARGPQIKRGLEWTHVDQDGESIASGGAISRGQIEAVAKELKRLKEFGFQGTVGVVTPFRGQANRIRDRAMQEFQSRPPGHWCFHVDTADGFQGDERDVILLSIPVGDELSRGAKWFLSEGRNRFNVAASRARALLHIFSDEQWCAQCDIPHISRLASAYQSGLEEHMGEFRSDLIGPKWEPELAKAMKRAGLPFQQQYPACGRYLDFALIRDGLKLDVEVDGEAFHRDSSVTSWASAPLPIKSQ